MTTMNTFPAGGPSLQRTFVPWFQVYDEPTGFRSFGFDSGFSGSDDVDDIAVDGGGMDADVGVAQQLARVLLTLFLGGIVYVWEDWGLHVSFIVQC